jgi:hypothetical protein
MFHWMHLELHLLRENGQEASHVDCDGVDHCMSRQAVMCDVLNAV